MLINRALHIIRKLGKIMTKGILGILHLVFAVWAILNIIGSSTTDGKKVLWTLFVLLFPVVGLIVWFLAGPKSTKKLL